MHDKEPAMEIVREVRFAVVLYGGVSLAIYINGVTQELLQLAAATAEDPGTPGEFLYEKAAGTSKSYRTLARLLSMTETERQTLEAQLAAAPDLKLDDLGLPDRVAVKFVIDTISGTSAGGINGIFLGKALANNQTLNQLEQMWIQEGDILKLLNDRESTRDLGAFPSPNPPDSLLNGRRMYRRLVEALDDMDVAALATRSAGGAGPVSGASGFVEDLDVFATTTDVNGLPVYLRLADGVVTERRHKNVFQFSHRQEAGVVSSTFFSKQNNPFLAYAARCTSSFPIAFAPMTLASVGDVLVTMPDHLHEQSLGLDKQRWMSCFPMYQPSSDVPEAEQNPAWFEFENRPFCDGGYLDNKPFSHAIDVLSQRVSRLPVDRKLIYIEPDPEHPERAKAFNRAPNPIENALLSTSLASYETIREDLERVLDRNLLIERVNRLLAGSDDDVMIWREHDALSATDDDKMFLDGDLKALIAKYGVPYGGYHRLKVGALTDEIGDWVGAAANFQANSAYIRAIALLIRVWREKNYLQDKNASASNSEARFLFDFDLSYRIRRLRFVIQRLDALRRAGIRGETALPEVDTSECFAEMKARVAQNPETVPQLTAVRSALHTVLSDLMAARRRLLASGTNNLLYSLLAGAAPGVALLKLVLSGRTFDERYAQAQVGMVDPGMLALFDRVASGLREYVRHVAVDASKTARGALQKAIDGASPASLPVLKLVQSFYLFYQSYDFVSFPVVYSTNVGEELCTTEVIRISPEDANTLVDRSAGDTRRKLAGTVLMHFGAFLEQKWRRNDILWGRLDGAERLIKSLLPQNCAILAAALIRDAHLEILEAYFAPMNSKALLDYSSAAIGQLGPNNQTARLMDFFNGPAGTAGKVLLQDAAVAVVQQSLGPAKLLEFFARQDGYEVSLEPTPATSASSMSRATTIIGKMLEKIGDDLQVGAGSRLGSWTTRAGQVMWGLVEVTMPGSLLRLLGQYWVKVAYLLEVILILGGMLLGNPGAQKLGWTLFALTLVATTLMWLLVDWFAGRARAGRIVRSVILILLLIVVAVGVDTIWKGIAEKYDDWQSSHIDR